MPFRAYLRFIAANRRFVAFGFGVAFGSSFGQTYIIGIFGPSLQQEFDLNHTVWGTIYLLGTLASAAVLPWTGRMIDRVDLRTYTLAVAVFFVAACLFMSVVSSAAMLVLAIFLLRHGGQGLMAHVSVTSMARYFERDRGKAVVVSALGFASAEACLPLLAVMGIAVLGWRATYGLAAGVLALLLIPAFLWLLRGHAARHLAHVKRQEAPQPKGFERARSWTRREVLGDARFYLLLPGVTAPSMVLTAMFFHHLNMADAKAWSHAWVTGNYVVYAVAAVVTSVFCGPAIDRIGGARLVPYMLFPMIGGLALVAGFDSPWVVWPYMLLIGVSTGLTYTIVAAMWAEIYGVGNLGAIKSMATALGIFASALGPVIVGGLMDLGAAFEQILIVFGLYSVFAAGLMFVALRDRTGA